MGIFTRFRDIVSSNINAMLDRAEDPEKMIKLMIREMEDTLVELKAACATVMAEQKKIQRKSRDAADRAGYWKEKAALAVTKGRDDLAREALVESRRFQVNKEAFENDSRGHAELVANYKQDIRQLEDKLKAAKEKQRLLVQRHIRANRKRQAQEEIRRADSTGVMLKFDELENRIEQMEAEADMVNYGRQTPLEEELEKLSYDEEIEKELQRLKTTTPDKDEHPASTQG